MSEEWLNELTTKDLPDGLLEAAQVVGIKTAFALANHFGGTYYYFPKVDKLLATLRDKKIREEFNGANHRELAMKYKLSETWVRQIVGKPLEKKTDTDKEQTSLFPPVTDTESDPET